MRRRHLEHSLAGGLFEIYDKQGPFGDPDGSRENFDRFISFAEHQAWGGLATRRDDLKARVLVGAKGSGKTLYRRILENSAISSPSLYVFRHTLQIASCQNLPVWQD